MYSCGVYGSLSLILLAAAPLLSNRLGSENKYKNTIQNSIFLS